MFGGVDVMPLAKLPNISKGRGAGWMVPAIHPYANPAPHDAEEVSPLDLNFGCTLQSRQHRKVRRKVPRFHPAFSGD
jgi:hypothetical protein